MFYQKSFSVIELMIAIFILVVAIIGFYQAAVFSFTTLEQTKKFLIIFVNFIIYERRKN